MSYSLLSEGASNAKLIKNSEVDNGRYYSVILYLAPSKLNAMGIDLCPFASAECIAACLNEAGRGAFANVQAARVKKANLYVSNPQEFFRLLDEDLASAQAKADKLGKQLVVRLNGTSDVINPYWLMTKYSRAQFMDYTKDKPKYAAFVAGMLPANYFLAFSFTPEGEDFAQSALRSFGGNVAVVFHGSELPATWHGFPVVDGDSHDLIFLRPQGSVIGLKAKGKAKKLAMGGFIQIAKAS